MNENIDNKAKKDKEEKDMATSWKEVMGRYIGSLTGHAIGEEHIHSDEIGWFYYISPKSLEANHPLIMNHYRGPLFVAIPYREYDMLESGAIDPVKYVDEAFWNFGYFWGGGSLIDGSYWQPFEKEPGIHNKEQIDTYLTILSCRTNFTSSGHKPTEEMCEKCPLSTCHFSEYKENCEPFTENDLRKTLYHEMEKRVKRETGMELIGICVHYESDDKVILTPNMCKPNTLMINIPVSVNNALLYHPEERDWTAFCNSFKMEMTTGKNNGPRIFVEGDTDEACQEAAWRFLESNDIIKYWHDWSKRLEATTIKESGKAEDVPDKKDYAKKNMFLMTVIALGTWIVGTFYKITGRSR